LRERESEKAENERRLPCRFENTSSALSLTCAHLADLDLMRGLRQAYAYKPTKEILDVEGRSLQ
jgi:hypothetical protein